MSNWIKTNVTKEQVFDLSQKYGIDSLTSSIFVRRGITSGNDILFYLEDDLRFLHNPFLFNQMEDAVDRILDARDEGEKVLIFGDRDVDGITSTTILYEYLKSIGVDVQYKVPLGDEAYGMNNKTIDEFAENYGSLIITVDCGIANFNEIKHAAELGIDVIVTDHHNPQDILPEPAIIINPKLSDSTYPFRDISGCAVAFKLVQALRFAQSDFYKNEICLLNAYKNEFGCTIECVKLFNNVEKDRLIISDIKEPLKISNTKLEMFFKGQSILTWDDASIKPVLKEVFGSAVDFNTFDIRPEFAKQFPAFSTATLSQLNAKSKIAKYNENASTNLDAFINIYITYIQHYLNRTYGQIQMQELQLVGLAALADIMPLRNENRIFVNYALKMINSGNARRGIIELLSRLNLLSKKITATDLSWNLIPALNATGRLGQPELGIKILMEEDERKRSELAEQIIALNTEKKSLVTTAVECINYNCQQSYEKYQNFCLTIDKRINRGIIGLISMRMSQKYSVPAITMTMADGLVTGSMRSCRGLDCTVFLSKFNSIFTNYGGHTKAAGFSLQEENLPAFQSQFDQLVKDIQLEDVNTDLIIDAELPPAYINPDLFKLKDLFEPVGEQNPELTFMTKGLKIIAYQIVGKTEKQHLKLTFDAGEHKIPAMYWGASEKLGREFNVGDSVDIVYNVDRNVFNGAENLQLIISDLVKNN